MNKLVKISHRGNIFGPTPEFENHPKFIQNALNSGYDVEIDLWVKNNKLYLGHDEPQHHITKDFLYNDKFWIHCKNIEALYTLLPYKNILNFFFHNADEAVLTSQGYIWHYPNDKSMLTNKSIAVMPERTENWDLTNCYGICSDYLNNY